MNNKKIAGNLILFFIMMSTSACTSGTTSETAMEIESETVSETEQMAENIEKNDETALPDSSISHFQEVEKGANIYNEIMEKTQWTENEPSYSDFFMNWSQETHKQSFLEVPGHTSEQWEEMTSYEQAMYTLLFVRPYSILTGTNSQSYTEDEMYFINHLGMFVESTLEKLEDGEEIYQEICDMWSWYYENYRTNHIVINPSSSIIYNVNGNEFELTDYEIEEILEAWNE